MCRLFSCIALYALLAFIVSSITVVFHILFSLGLYQMARNKKVQYYKMAFFPIVNLYILGKIINRLKIAEYEIPFIEIILPLSVIISVAFWGIPLIGFVIGVLCWILHLFAFNKLFKLYIPSLSMLYTILSIVIPFMPAVFIYILRNKLPN